MQKRRRSSQARRTSLAECIPGWPLLQKRKAPEKVHTGILLQSSSYNNDESAICSVVSTWFSLPQCSNPFIFVGVAVYNYYDFPIAPTKLTFVRCQILGDFWQAYSFPKGPVSFLTQSHPFKTTATAAAAVPSCPQYIIAWPVEWPPPPI